MWEPDYTPASESKPTQSQGGWQQFAATGSIYDYLDYKTRMEKQPYADSDDRAGAAAGESGRGRPDPDPSDP